MSSKLSYLQKYLSSGETLGDDADKKKRKKKKKRDKQSGSHGGGFKIIDDDGFGASGVKEEEKSKKKVTKYYVDKGERPRLKEVRTEIQDPAVILTACPKRCNLNMGYVFSNEQSNHNEVKTKDRLPAKWHNHPIVLSLFGPSFGSFGNEVHSISLLRAKRRMTTLTRTSCRTACWRTGRRSPASWTSGPRWRS